MSFTSFGFLIFVLAVLVIYYIVPSKVQWIVILVSSTVFYITNGIENFLFLLMTTMITWLCALILTDIQKKFDIIEKDENKTKEERNHIKLTCKKYRKIVLIAGLLCTLGLLAYCKYTNFLISSINAILNGERFTMQNVIVPLGVSFYTFMSVGYLLDVYWKKYEAEENIFRYLTFTTYFPHIVQGPISRYQKLSAEFFVPKKFDWVNVKSGALLVIWGFFEKLVIADRLHFFVSSVFGDYKNQYGVIWFVTLALYSVQTYADFLGCMDIARGVSQMLGVKLERNFNHPYFAKNIPEFWRRWHMTMGAWFKDYLFFPVSNSKFVKNFSKKLGNKYGANARRNFVSCFSVAIVWLATGIWHGAGWNFVLWGMYYGVLTIGGTLLHDKFEKLNKLLHINTDTYAWKLFQMARTFFLCCMGRVFFRTGSLEQAITVFKNMFSRLEIWRLTDGTLLRQGLDAANLAVAVIAILVLWVVSMMQERFCIRERFFQQNVVFRWLILYIAIFSIIIFGIYGPGFNAVDFIYGQF